MTNNAAIKLDRIDRELLKLLQEDATIPMAKLAEQVHLSPTPCWRRIQRLREAGIIRKQVMLLDAEKLGLGITVFVSIKTNQHSREWTERFLRGIQVIPEVVEFYRMSGDVDYLLRVLVKDIAGYDAVYKQLIQVADLAGVSSGFAMEQLKFTTALPIQ